MKLGTMTDLAAGLMAVSLAALAGCGGSTPSTPNPTGSATPSPNPTAPPAAGSSADAVCRSIGYGVAFAPCDNKAGPSLLPYVEEAMDRLVAAQPSIFDTSVQDGVGGYKVLDNDRYYQGMISTLATMGVCSSTYPFGERLLVKNTNESSESYDILNGRGNIRRGRGAYYDTCSPPAFPLPPDQMFVKVRVSFFGFFGDVCRNPPTPLPGTGEGRLPVVCSGIVTATPLDANGIKTPASLHGDDVSFTLRSGGEYVAVYPAGDGNPFNYIVQGKAVGPFSLCATVKGMEGCLNGEVIQYP